MDIIEAYYGARTFTLYSLFASVPAKRRWPRILFITLGITVLSFLVLFQVIKLVTERFNLECFIDVAPTTVATFGTLVYMPYVAFTTGQDFNVLLSIIMNDLREERTEAEDAIKRVHAESVKLCVTIFTIILVSTTCGLPLAGFLPYLLDLFVPLNESREIQLLVDGEIFIDKDKYFYLIYFLESYGVLVVCVVIFISENVNFIIVQHICGMWAVIGYRLENLTRHGEEKFPGTVNYTNLVESRLRRCIADHQKALQFAALVTEFYDIPLMLILIGCFCTLTVSLVQVLDPRLFTLKMTIITFTQFFQLYLVSYTGQLQIDSSERISKDASNAEWDVCPAKVRRLLQLVMLRSSKPCVFIARGIYVLSIENFMAVMQTVTSCYMVLRQTS